MFYSHQLLARKAPLGQIWMAATMHAKINRRKLDKLDIIKICEEILNPSVPMALRLSGILMGGVVIVYERKVKLLFDDVTRFLVEINEAWKIKSVVDPTILPKGKTQAKYEAVTLPDHVVDMEVEQPMHFSDASITTARFQRMRLDDLDELYININTREDDLSQHYHQAEAANITIFDDFSSGLAETEFYNRFERFDIDGDEETQINFTPQEHPQAPPNLIPSPAPQNDHPQAPTSDIPSTPLHHDPLPDDVTMAPPMEEQEEQQEKERSNGSQEAEENTPRRQPIKRKARRNLTHVVMDNDQIMIPGSVYQSWLQDASNIVSKRGRKNKPLNPLLSTKISNLMDLPPVALISGLQGFPAEVNYPAPLMELWRKCTDVNPAHRSPSGGGISPQVPENPAAHSPPEGLYRQEVPDLHPGDFQSEVGSQPADSIEMLRAHLGNMDFEVANEAGNLVTPGSPGGSTKSIPSSGSGHAFGSMEPEILPSGRSKRRQQSSSRASMGNLDPVDEEIPLEQNGRSYKLKKLSEHEPSSADQELMEETGPTQTPHPMFADSSVDKITQSIRTHLKSHFDTPGAPQFESLDQLATGMNRKKAAQLFYQTCVLATFDFVKVQQIESYGDILISRGPKM